MSQHGRVCKVNKLENEEQSEIRSKIIRTDAAMNPQIKLTESNPLFNQLGLKTI